MFADARQLGAGLPQFTIALRKLAGGSGQLSASGGQLVRGANEVQLQRLQLLPGDDPFRLELLSRALQSDTSDPLTIAQKIDFAASGEVPLTRPSCDHREAGGDCPRRETQKREGRGPDHIVRRRGS